MGRGGKSRADSAQTINVCAASVEDREGFITRGSTINASTMAECAQTRDRQVSSSDQAVGEEGSAAEDEEEVQRDRRLREQLPGFERGQVHQNRQQAHIERARNGSRVPAEQLLR